MKIEEVWLYDVYVMGGVYVCWMVYWNGFIGCCVGV